MSTPAAPWEDDFACCRQGHANTASADEVADLVATIFAAPWEDAARIPMVANEAVRVLGELAVAGSHEATQCLRRLHRAVDLGAPLDEPKDPSWM